MFTVQPQIGLKFVANTNISELLALLACGLMTLTSLNCCFTFSTKSSSRSPWKTLTKKLPSGLSVSEAIHSAFCAKSTCRAWSTSHMPEMLGDASEITTSAFLGSISRICCIASSSVMSQIIVLTYCCVNGSIGFRSKASTKPLLPTVFLAAWIQPPGAAPRSMTTSPRFINSYFLIA